MSDALTQQRKVAPYLRLCPWLGASPLCGGTRPTNALRLERERLPLDGLPSLSNKGATRRIAPLKRSSRFDAWRGAPGFGT
jgi:hypothetical protein